MELSKKMYCKSEYQPSLPGLQLQLWLQLVLYTFSSCGPNIRNILFYTVLYFYSWILPTQDNEYYSTHILEVE